MLPPGCAERAMYAGDSSTRLKAGSVGPGVVLVPPASVGALKELMDSAREMRVTGGGLQSSYTGSSELLRSCLVLIGARIEHVVIDVCASNVSMALWLRFSPS